MKKVILYIATSIDGFIADEKGSVDWLPQPEEGCDYGYNAFLKTIDTVLMGRKTYEQVLSFEGGYPYQKMKNYIFTSKKLEPLPYIEFTDQKPEELIDALKKEKGKAIWLVGGEKLNTACLKKERIDELMMFVIPKILGKGIPLFLTSSEAKLLETETYPDGVVKLHYKLSLSTPLEA